MFIAAPFTIGRRWKQYKCPSTEAWINKIWHEHGGYHSALIGKNSMLTCYNMDEDIMLNEISKAQEVNTIKFHLHRHLK